MSRMDLEDALQSAAEGSKAQLDHDREKLARRGETILADALAYVGEHLFCKDLTAADVAKAAGTNPSWLARRCRRHLDRSCFDYFSSIRLTTAANMVAANPALGVDEVVQSVGGLSGRWMRLLCRECGRENPTPREPEEPFALRRPASWKRLAEGALTLTEQKALGLQLGAMYPEAFAIDTRAGAGREYVRAPAITLVPSIGGGGTVDGAVLARFVAEHEVWPTLSGLPYEAQRLAVQQYVFTSPEFFDLLRQKSREEGCRDRQRGIELAELALLSLDVSAPALGEKIQELRALGWAWLGNARRLALDFPGAEKDFERAMKELALVEGWADSLVAAKIYALKAALHIFRRRFKEALKLLDYSLVIFEKVGDRRRLIEGLMTRAAAADYAGCSEAAVSNLKAALGVAKALKDEGFRIKVSVNLGMALVNWNRFEDGASVVESLDRHACYQVDPRLAHLVQWIEGIVQHGLGNPSSAEERYLAAYAGFQGLGDLFYATFVDLDIAILYAETGKATEVCRIAAAILSFFEALSLGDEALVSLRLLKDALRSQAVSEAVLRRVRSALRGDPLVETFAEGARVRRPRLQEG